MIGHIEQFEIHKNLNMQYQNELIRYLNIRVAF